MTSATLETLGAVMLSRIRSAPRTPLAGPTAYGRSLLAGALAAGTLALAACGTAGGSGTTAAAGAKPSISITEPKANATVTEPFTLKVASSEQLGPTDSGMDHFHLTFDGNAQQYTVETSPTVVISTLSPGKHTIKVTLQHADHSPVGPAAQVSVMVAGPGGMPSGTSSGTPGTPATPSNPANPGNGGGAGGGNGY